MKKVGIITLNGYTNYGNRLQNYALQEILKTYDFEVETILVNASREFGSIPLSERITSMNFLEIIRKVNKRYKLKVDKKKYGNINTEREERIKSFSKKYIKETEYQINDNNIPVDKLEYYDFFVVGSDQVWNPSSINGIYFLDFCPSYKRVSYAASFGVSNIESRYQNKYKNWIEDFKHISVREDAGATIIKELTGRDVPILVDPTMLIKKDEWLSISKEHVNKPKKGYILTYFLGDASNEIMSVIQQISTNNNWEIIHLAKVNQLNIYNADPSEFIDFINSANLFFTDSFHGTVFSIILDTPFIVTSREVNGMNMNSRIDTLLAKVKLESRNWNIVKQNKDSIFNISLSHTSQILEKERMKAFNYLDEAFDIKRDLEL